MSDLQEKNNAPNDAKVIRVPVTEQLIETDEKTSEKSAKVLPEKQKEEYMKKPEVKDSSKIDEEFKPIIERINRFIDKGTDLNSLNSAHEQSKVQISVDIATLATSKELMKKYPKIKDKDIQKSCVELFGLKKMTDSTFTRLRKIGECILETDKAGLARPTSTKQFNGLYSIYSKLKDDLSKVPELWKKALEFKNENMDIKKALDEILIQMGYKSKPEIKSAKVYTFKGSSCNLSLPKELQADTKFMEEFDTLMKKYAKVQPVADSDNHIENVKAKISLTSQPSNVPTKLKTSISRQNGHSLPKPA